MEGYVQRRDPGNPQRPITAWAPGHGDEQALRVQEVYGRLEAYAEENGGEVGYRRIVEELAPHLQGRVRVLKADELARRLIRAGVKVWR